MKSKTLFLLSLVLVVTSCYRTDVVPQPSKEVVDIPQPLKSLIQISTKAGTTTFNVEVADTDALRSQGLMRRESLPANTGMIFLFDKEAEHSFWMKNTLLALDLVFFDSSWIVVGVIESMTPLSQESRTIGKPSRHVLEINAGLVKSLNIAIGDKALITNEANKPHAQ